MKLRLIVPGITLAMLVTLSSSIASAASRQDEMLGNAALRELHKVASAGARSEQAAKDGDLIGCREASESLQHAAHEALRAMHAMSFAPRDALERLSSLVRLTNLFPGECPDDLVVKTNMLPVTAGQAIIGLRTDYAIGADDWYVVQTDGSIESKNPLRYAESLDDKKYSWVDVRAKGLSSSLCQIGGRNWPLTMWVMQQSLTWELT